LAVAFGGACTDRAFDEWVLEVDTEVFGEVDEDFEEVAVAVDVAEVDSGAFGDPGVCVLVPDPGDAVFCVGLAISWVGRWGLWWAVAIGSVAFAEYPGAVFLEDCFGLGESAYEVAGVDEVLLD